jgi:tetratricopeptide (TPR) repeat protein
MESSLATSPANPTFSFGITRRRISETQALELRGSILMAQGKTEEALDKLRNSIAVYAKISYDEPPSYLRLPHETLGEALIKAKLYDEAIATYKKGLFYRPNSGWLLYGIARAHEEAGKKSQAINAYKAFLIAWKTADEDRPEVIRAKAFLK